MIASSSAMTTRTGVLSDDGTGLRSGSAGREFGRDAVEKGILLALELHDVAAERVTMAGERVGVSAGVARLDIRERGFGDERAQAGVFGLLLEEHELLFGDGQLDAQPLEPVADIDEAPLKDRTRHGP